VRIPLACMPCLSEGRITIVPVQVRDDSRYSLTCHFGHTTVTVSQQLKFEVLYEIGASAILDGYYREAVASFAASLERFYEFSIRVLLSAENPHELADSCLKKLKLSEPQRGAFVGLWTAAFKDVPALQSNSRTEFRNNVIHNGKIPSKEEAISFGEDVLNLLRPQMSLLVERFGDVVSQAMERHINSIPFEPDDYGVAGTMTTPSLVSLRHTQSKNPQRQSLTEYLSYLGVARMAFIANPLGQ